LVLQRVAELTNHQIDSFFKREKQIIIQQTGKEKKQIKINMNFLKGLSKLVSGEFFENEVNQ